MTSLKDLTFIQALLVAFLVLMATVDVYSSPVSPLAIPDVVDQWPSASDRLIRKARGFDIDSDCTHNMPCMWAVCDWSVYVTVNSGRCDFIPSVCKCRIGQRCKNTNDVTPNQGYLTVTYTCQ